MPMIWTLLSDWGYVLAAAMYATLAILASRTPGERGRAALVTALTVTALWSLNTVVGAAVGQAMNAVGGIAETMRNAAWLWLMWTLLGATGTQAEGRPLPRGAIAAVGAVGFALVCQCALDLVLGGDRVISRGQLPLLQASWLLRAATAMGAILVLQGLFARIGRAQMGRTGWLACALTVLWAFEFNHYLLASLSDGRVLALGQMRGVLLALIAPLIILGTSPRERRFALSRRATYQLVTLGIGALYALTLLAMIMLVRTLDDPASRIVQLGAVFALSVIALVLLPSAPFRAWLRQEIARHLFAHRYDYREAWAQFAEGLADDGSGAEPPLRRAVAAVARAMSAPGARLYLRQNDATVIRAADWHWPGTTDATIADALPQALVEHLESAAAIIEVAPPHDPPASLLPDSIAADPAAWALAPLVHRGRLVGALLIARPPGRGPLDWEDLDMLRVVARQLAVTLSERQHQQALAEAQRFDEFNRRFAFILHDIKNLVSQISLLAANAERHADNPAFRADMILTLRESGDRMNDLLARLARTDPPREPGRAACDLAAICRTLATGDAMLDRIRYDGPPSLTVRGDGEALQQAVVHLIQNAIEATPDDAPPVMLTLATGDGTARLSITDRGCGMSAAFISERLFRPFISTKVNGFGLGAHEARTLVMGMGGQLDVASREGEGTCFTITLPLIDARGEDCAGPQSVMRKAG